MPDATDGFSLLRQAIVAIITGDAALQTLFGRATNLIVTWKTFVYDPLPQLVYQLSGFAETGGIQDTERGTLQISAFFAGNDALANAEAAIARVKQILSAPAFETQGIDACPVGLVARDYPSVGDGGDESRESDSQGTRNVRRADAHIPLEFTIAA